MRLLNFIFGPKKSQLESYEEAAGAIEAFVDGRSGKWDWDDFTSRKKKYPFLESVRQRCLAVCDDYPAKNEGRYCSDEGLDVLRAIAREVRAEIARLPKEEAISHHRQRPGAPLPIVSEFNRSAKDEDLPF